MPPKVFLNNAFQWCYIKLWNSFFSWIIILHIFGLPKTFVFFFILAVGVLDLTHTKILPENPFFYFMKLFSLNFGQNNLKCFQYLNLIRKIIFSFLLILFCFLVSYLGIFFILDFLVDITYVGNQFILKRPWEI